MLIRFVSALGAVSPTFVASRGLSPLYVRSIHANYEGAWDFNLAWKPLNGFPVYAAWVRAIHHAHVELRSGLDIPCPILVMSSTASSG